VVCRRFWRPAAARTGPCGQPLFSAAKRCKHVEIAANASVLRFCIGVVRPCGCCPAPAAATFSGRAAAGRTPAGAAPATAWRRGSNRLEAGQQPPRGRTDAVRGSRAAFAARQGSSCPAPASGGRLLPIIARLKRSRGHYQLAADFVARLAANGGAARTCSPFPRPRRWALALRRHASFLRSDQSGHAEQPAMHAGHAARRNRTRNAAGSIDSLRVRFLATTNF
jgi:hypothetical protein